MRRIEHNTNHSGLSTMDLERRDGCVLGKLQYSLPIFLLLVSRVSQCSRGVSFVMCGFPLLLLRPLAYKCVLGN